MKKYNFIFILVLVLFMTFAFGCKNDKTDTNVKATSIIITGKNVLTVGEEEKLNYEVLPDNASDKEVVWSVSNSRYATVSSDGVVSAKASGKVTIYCELASDGTIYGEFEITITSDDTIKVTNIVIYGREIMAIGGSQTLSIDVFPTDASSKAVTFTSSDSNIATVNNDGVVNALKTGTVIITVEANDSGKFKKEFTIEVLEKIDANAIDVNYKSSMNVGDEQVLVITLFPSTATSDYTISSSNENVLTVNNMGIVKAISVGFSTVTITVNSTIPFTKEISIQVTEELLDVSEIQTLINTTYNTYKSSYIGSAKMIIINNDDEKELTYKYSFASDLSNVNAIEYVLTGEVDNSLYVRDGIIYMNEAGNTGKYELDSSEASAFIKNYNFDRFFSSGIPYKQDNSFFNHLSLSSYEDYQDQYNATYIYELDIRNYDGTTLNLINVYKVELIVTLNNGDISEGTYRAYSGNDIKAITILFLGFECNIEYPNEINDYPDVM